MLGNSWIVTNMPKVARKGCHFVLLSSADKRPIYLGRTVYPLIIQAKLKGIQNYDCNLSARSIVQLLALLVEQRFKHIKILGFTVND